MKQEKEPLGDSIYFDSYILNTKTGMMTTESGSQLFMEHRLRDLFITLLKNKGEFVSKKELMKLAWKGTIVSDQSVSKAVSDLRRFFSAHKLENLKITTVRKVGYKLEIEEPLQISPVRKPVKLKQVLPYTVAAVLLLIFFLMHH